MRFQTCVLLLFLGMLGDLSAQDGRVRFSNYSARSGLGSTSVNGLAQDSTGYLWIATADGVRRYDGYRFVEFRAEPGSTDGLPDNAVSSVHVDHFNRKWFGTREGGIARLLEATGRFSRYAGDAGAVHAFTEAPDGRLLAATAHGILTFDEADDCWVNSVTAPGWLLPSALSSEVTAPVATWAEQIFPDTGYAYQSLVVLLGPETARRQWPDLRDRLRPEAPRDGLGPAYANVTALLPNADGDLFVGYYHGGVGVLRVGERHPHVLQPNLRSGRGGKSQVNGLLLLGDSLLVARVDRGVEIIHTRTGQGRAFIPALTNVPIQELTRRGDLLYLATSMGIIVRDLTNGTEIRYDATGDYEYGMAAAETNCVLPGDDGVIWVGHGLHGLSRGTNAHPLATYPRPDDPPLPHYMRGATAMLQDQQGRLWLGYYEGGIRHVETASLTTRKTYLTEDRNGIERSSVFTLFEDRNGRIWGGGYRSGLIYFDEKREDWFPFFPGDPATLGSPDVRAITQDSDGHLWLALHGFGVVRFTPETGETRSFTPLNSDLACSYPFDLSIDHLGRVWVATVNGLFRIATDHAAVTAVIPSATGGQNGFYHRATTVTSLNESCVAVGTQEGLLLFGPDGQPKTDVRVPEQLQKPIRALHPDPSTGGLWATTEFSAYYFHPGNGLLLGYRLPADGEDRSFSPRSRVLTSGRKLLFGTTTGLVRLDPAQLRTPSLPGTPYLSSLRYTDAQGTPREQWATEGPLTLGPDNVGFSLDLSSFSYNRPRSTRFEVRLSPHQEKWTELPADNPSLIIHHLSPGDYTVQYRTRHEHGHGSGPVHYLLVRVAPHWYATNWAYAAYSLIGIGMVILYLRLARRRETLRQRVRYEQLRAAKEKELAEEKARFFESVSHDLRTPLTLIDTPLEALCRQPDLPLSDRRRYYDIMQRNSLRLGRMIGQLLNFRRLDVSSSSSLLVTEDINAYLHQLTEPFALRAKSQGIDLLSDIALPSSPVSFPGETIARVVENLLGNALKYTPAKGRIDVGARLHSSQLTLIIKDTGPGVPEADRERIFERFYRTPNQVGKTPGNGVGLAVVRELLEEVGGTISCTKGDQEGAQFICQLPLAVALPDRVTTPETFVLPDTTIHPAADEADGADTIFRASGSSAKRVAHLLVADDDPDIRAVIAQGARGRYRITEARDGAEALELARRLQPDLIISDVMMPHLKGTELCAALKGESATSHLPVLLLTAHHSDLARRKALAAGANAYLTKPFRLESLFQRVDNTLMTLTAARQRWMRAPEATVPAALGATTADQDFMARLRDFVLQRMAGTSIEQRALLRALAVSRTVCFAKVRALTGLSLGEYIKRLRIEHAQQLLHQPGISLSEVAFATGFKTTAHFARTFKAITGVTPGSFRKDLVGQEAT